MIRVLHISDLHIPAVLGGPQRRVVEAFLRDVEQLNRERSIDVVVFTGDLASDGSPEALATAQEHVLDPLIATLEISRERVVLIPGNHDVDRRRINPVVGAGLQSLLAAPETSSEVLVDQASLDSALERLRPWAEFQRSFYEGVAVTPVGSLATVHRIELASAVVGVAALNSAWCSYGGADDKGHLVVGSPQLDAALGAIEPCDLRIAAMHHPLDWLVNYDSDAVRLEFEQRRTIVLSGHDHIENPVSVVSLRGAALYGRGGCLYESAEYRNGYAAVDIDLDVGAATFSFRRWLPDRRVFDAALDIAEGGVHHAALPHVDQSVPVGQLAFSEVLAGLGELAAQRSVVADLLPERRGATPTDLLVEPRFWPVPFPEAVAAASQDRPPERADPAEVLRESSVVVVCGEGDSGVTSALIWLLGSQFSTERGRLPVLMGFERRLDARRLDRELRQGATRAGLVLGSTDEVPPLAIAIDDVSGHSPKAVTRVAKYVAEHAEHSFILGCHGDDHNMITEQLESHGVTARRIFLGPFGRRELRRLVRTIAGPGSDDFVDQIYEVVRSENLPRSPLVMAALTAVLLRGGELGEVNVSALLTAYVSLLLGGEDVGDLEGLGMDFRRREHLLAAFAFYLVERGRTKIPRLDAESHLAEYFRARGVGVNVSPGHVLDSLIGRRVLVEDHEGIGFRHGAIQQLFAAKWMGEDDAFSNQVVADCLRNANIVRHAAGLRRNDRRLLEVVGESARNVMEELSSELNVGLFDLIEDRHGWSDAPDIEGLKDRLQAEQINEDEVDEQLDALDDRRDAERDGSDAAPARPRSEIDRLTEAVRLLSNVLRSSELVDDVDLKTELLKEAINGWSLLTVIAALVEDQTSSIEDLVDEILPRDQEEEALVRSIVGLVVTLFIAFGIVQELGTVNLEVALTEAMRDDEFMASAARALLATVLYSELRFKDWPLRLRDLLRSHGRHPYVAQFVRVYAEVTYRFSLVPIDVRGRLESLLADIYVPAARGGPSAVEDRARARDEVIGQIRDARRETAGSAEGLGVLAETLEQATDLDEVPTHPEPL